MILSIDYVFDDDAGRVEGLRGKTLPIGSCALFVYDSRLPHSFWMRDVPIDLYLSAIVDGKCAESHRMIADTTVPHKISVASDLIIESRMEIPVDAVVSIHGDVLCVE